MDISKEKKKTSGRKKIEIKKLEKVTNKQVTFSKRRVGIFNKASELCILCNVQATIIVFSPADKLYCFGHPNTETIINNYVKGTTAFEVAESSTTNNSVRVEAEEYNRQYDEAIKKLELEKLEKKKVADVESLAKSRDWWNDPIDEMNSEQLEEFMVSIYEMKMKVAARVDKLVTMPAVL